jgi:hypothetical protein
MTVTKSTNPYFTPDQIQMLFKPQMVQAMLDGSKTETRHPIKDQPVFDGGVAACPVGRGPRSCVIYAHELNGIQHHAFPARCEPGDLVWVKETHFQPGGWVKTGEQTKGGKYRVRFDRVKHAPVIYQEGSDQSSFERDGLTYFTRPPLFMEKTDSRLTLRVTSYGIERLHAIDEAGAVAEGFPIAGGLDDNGNPAKWSREIPHESGVGMVAWDCALDWYADLWDSINGPDAWDANPWVEVIKFSVIKANIGEVKA